VRRKGGELKNEIVGGDVGVEKKGEEGEMGGDRRK